MISRILVISTNRETAPQPTMPVGAAWVAEALHLAGFVVKFLDLCFVKNPLRHIAGVVSTFKPEGIAISIRNIDNCDFLAPKSYLPEIREIITSLKSWTDAPILLGGSGVSIMPVPILDYLGLHYAVAGEGEVAAVEFFQASTPGRNRDMTGLVCRDNPGAIPDRPGQLCEIPLHPDLVMPRTYRWVNTRSYLRRDPVLPVQGKRGCANRCLYCTYNRIEGSKWRLRDPAAVAEEIATALVTTPAREFEFVDSIFNQPEGYVEALLEEIIRRELKVRLHISSVTPKGLTKEQVSLMERGGVASMVITPEAASDVTLGALNKDFTAEEVLRSSELLSASSIRALWCFLLGGPGEDAGTLAETIGFINERICRKDRAFITTGIRIFPHTGLHDLAIEEELVGRNESLLMPAFYFTPRLSPRKAREILQGGIANAERCIFLSDTSSSSIGTLRRIGTALKLPSPFWRYAGCLNGIIMNGRVLDRKW